MLSWWKLVTTWLPRSCARKLMHRGAHHGFCVDGETVPWRRDVFIDRAIKLIDFHFRIFNWTCFIDWFLLFQNCFRIEQVQALSRWPFQDDANATHAGQELSGSPARSKEVRAVCGLFMSDYLLHTPIVGTNLMRIKTCPPIISHCFLVVGPVLDFILSSLCVIESSSHLGWSGLSAFFLFLRCQAAFSGQNKYLNNLWLNCVRSIFWRGFHFTVVVRGQARKARHKDKRGGHI